MSLTRLTGYRICTIVEVLYRLITIYMSIFITYGDIYFTIVNIDYGSSLHYSQRMSA